MFIKLCKRKGQNTAEYAILIGVIVAAAIAMQVYVRRGMQGRIKDSVDFTREACTTMFNESQYEPYYTCSTFESNQASDSTDGMTLGGGVSRNEIQSSQRNGTQVYTDYTVANT